MAMTDLSLDLIISGKPRQVRIKHEERPADAYIAVDERQVSARMKLLPLQGAAHAFEIDAHPVVLVIDRDAATAAWEYDCFVDGTSVVNGCPFVYGRTDVVGLKRWAHQRRGGRNRFLVAACAKGLVLGILLFCLLFLAGMVFHLGITWIHLLVTILPLTALYALFAPFEWKQNEKAWRQYQAAMITDDVSPVGDTPVDNAPADEPPADAEPPVQD